MYCFLYGFVPKKKFFWLYVYLSDRYNICIFLDRVGSYYVHFGPKYEAQRSFMIYIPDSCFQKYGAVAFP